MKITISGKPGSGKSTIAELLAEKLNLKHYSMGDLQRSIAKEKGLTLIKLSRLEEEDFSIDKKVDSRLKQIGKKQDNFVIDTRLGFHFIPDSIKIYFDVSLDESAKRILKDKRKEETAKTIDELKSEIKNRIKSERKRYQGYYGLDIDDLTHYDLLIDTTDYSIKQVIDMIIKFISKYYNN